MRTLVVSDLHLGARTGVDVLRRRPALDALLGRLQGAGRLVLLGDTLELRHGPPRDALAAAEPVLAAIGEALGDAEVVLVPGNHDHGLIAPWLEARGHSGAPPPLGLEQRAGPDVTETIAAVARALRPARLEIAYPGLWLADGVYATHGHYLDRHSTIPSAERLAAGTLARVLGARVDEATGPDDYELVLAPLYALLDAVAARSPEGRVRHNSTSTRTWRALAGGRRRPLRHWLMAGGWPIAVGAINRAGLGPVGRDVSGPELRRAGLRAMGAVVGRLGIDARHVLFGHTHRAGPLDGDDPADWGLDGGGSLINCGSWCSDRDGLDPTGRRPYRPGGAVELHDGGPPRLVRLIDAATAEGLSRPPAPGPG